MTERWTHMLAALREQFPPEADVVELEQYLVAEGLDRHEIGEVLSLYYADTVEGGAAARSDAPFGARSAGPVPLRVQGPHERGRFTAEAWGYLVTLHESRVVSSFDFEQLVERALFHMDGRIGLSDIRTLANEVGLDAASLAADRTLLH
jgi:Smg protein